MSLRIEAMVAIGRFLRAQDYAFVTVTPETHRRVDRLAERAGRTAARDLRDVFGWSRPFRHELLPRDLFDLAQRGGLVEDGGSLYRSKIRFSSMSSELFVHSAFPTDDENAVFFGPDTYRYWDLVQAEAPRAPRPERVVDVGCGCGAAGILVAKWGSRVVLADVNDDALAMSRANARLAGVEDRVDVLRSDILAGVEGSFDLVIANPPYLADPASRAYRDGGGELGEGLGVKIAAESLGRLRPSGTLVLYTGSAIVAGHDAFFEAARDACARAGATWHYRELDPDVFGEELERNEAYAEAERIAAVGLVATVPR